MYPRFRRFSHVPSVLPTNVEQRISNLSKTCDLDRLHQFFKHVSSKPCNVLELGECSRSRIACNGLSVGDTGQAILFFFRSSTCQFHFEIIGTLPLFLLKFVPAFFFLVKNTKKSNQSNQRLSPRRVYTIFIRILRLFSVARVPFWEIILRSYSCLIFSGIKSFNLYSIKNHQEP